MGAALPRSTDVSEVPLPAVALFAVWSKRPDKCRTAGQRDTPSRGAPSPARFPHHPLHSALHGFTRVARFPRESSRDPRKPPRRMGCGEDTPHLLPSRAPGAGPVNARESVPRGNASSGTARSRGRKVGSAAGDRKVKGRSTGMRSLNAHGDQQARADSGPWLTGSTLTAYRALSRAERRKVPPWPLPPSQQQLSGQTSRCLSALARIHRRLDRGLSPEARPRARRVFAAGPAGFLLPA